ncbi:MAG TPA: BlaI/MecI/CopY family transcriptional regulator [Planctomycetes bacterium]|nr:BlaI/MecI/CopY family transcriptional regulator [Planctomycetota bacterium]
MDKMEPTARELQILKVLWDREEATVREVYESLREQLPIVQNTVQAFLRIMEEKELVTHTTRGRSFVYRAELPRAETSENLLSGMLDDVFDGALDALVASAFALKPPSKGELERLRELLAQHEQNQWRKR